LYRYYKGSIITDAIKQTDAVSGLRRLYHWTLSWADHPNAGWALFLIAMIEASVFPIPPDILLIALALGKPNTSFRFAAQATAGTTLGAVIGYGIGMFLFTTVALPIIEFYNAMDTFKHVQQWFVDYGVMIVLVAGFSPIPFKVFTIAAGAFGLSFPAFIVATVVSRGTRFYLEAALLRWGGDRLRDWVEQYFEWLTVAVAVAVVGGFALLWW